MEKGTQNATRQGRLAPETVVPARVTLRFPDWCIRVALALSDFELVRRLGDGSLAQVVLARQKHTHKQYAIKIIDKHLVVKHKQTKYVKNERFLLDKINYEGICDLHFTFQDQHSLYLVLELCPNGMHPIWCSVYCCVCLSILLYAPSCSTELSNVHLTVGELYDQIQEQKQIGVADARIYAAEIVLMLQTLRQEKASLPMFLTTCHMMAHIFI